LHEIKDVVVFVVSGVGVGGGVVIVGGGGVVVGGGGSGVYVSVI